ALEGIVRPAVREPLSRARESLIELTSKWLADLGSPAPREHCRILFDYLDGLIFHQVAMPEPDFDPKLGIRTVLGAFLPPSHRIDGADEAPPGCCGRVDQRTGKAPLA
ncbi:hypothetical protein ACFY4A_41225, partial [Streptomyces sp. NPDC001292]